MAIYFTRDFGRPILTVHRCLFCEQVFSQRQELSEHYMSAHESAFSAAELEMARAQRANVTQNLRQ